MTSRRNVLFVIIDQLRADCLFGEFSEHVNLPNLRALMSESVSFANHFSVCSPCGPSRASILTGQYAMNHRSVRNGTPLRHDIPNLAGEARKAGCDPLLFGYTDTTQDPRILDRSDPKLSSYEEVMNGFREVVRMRQEDDSGPWRAHLTAKGYDIPPYPDLYRPAGPEIDDPALYCAQDSDTAFLTDCVLHDLAVRPGGWFAHVTYIRPHPPFVAPAPYNRMYDPATLPPARAGQADHAYTRSTRAGKRFSDVVTGFPDLEPTEDNIARVRAIYLGLATEVDHHIGRLIKFLKDSGQWNETLVVITSDHGEMLGDYGLWGKQTYHDAAFRTSLIVRDPAFPRNHGSVVRAPTESVDVAPTVLDLLGCPVPHSMDGCSLRPFISGERTGTWKTYTYSELDFGNPVEPTFWQRDLGLGPDDANLAVLRTERYRLVHFAGGLPQVVFDMANEGEACDISGDAGAQDICLELSRLMLSHRMRHADGVFARTMVTSAGLKIAEN